MTTMTLPTGPSPLAPSDGDGEVFTGLRDDVRRRICEEERANALNALASTIAHRVRNPLAGISAAVQVVAASLPEDDVRREALGHVLEQVTRLGVLCGDLLAFTQKTEPRQRHVDLAALAVAAASQAAARDVVTITGHGAARADPLLVQQVLAQLFVNALDAGARHIHVQVTDGAVVLDDDGPGIDASVRQHVFEPFFTTTVTGSGLGLTIAHRVVAAMSGTIAADASDVLGGARFTLRLPLSHVVAEPIDTTATVEVLP